MDILIDSWLTTVTIIFTIIITVYFYMTRNHHYWKQRGFVEIPTVPFFGNFAKYFTFQKSPGYLLKSFYEQSEHLPYVGFYVFNKPFLLLRDPEIIKRIFITDFNAFSGKVLRSNKNDTVSNNSFISIENPYWKYVRGTFVSLFTPVKMKKAFQYCQDVGKDLDNLMATLTLEASGKKTNMEEVCGKYNTDVTGLILFGLKLNSLRNPNAEFRKFGKEMFGIYSLRRNIQLFFMMYVPQIVDFFGFRFFEKRCSDFFKKTFVEIMKERKDLNIKRDDLMDLLIKLQNHDENNYESTGFKFEGDNLIAQAVIFFASGYISSTTTMNFALYELAKNLDIQTKLRKEINETISKNQGRTSYEVITGLQYLEMVILETLRMYPHDTVLHRKATRDYKIENTGLIIEKGTAILVPMLGIHYDPKYYPNPEVFNPENFSNENKASRHSCSFLAFGLGPRNCIGMTQGLLQMKIGIIHIISRFEVTLAKNSSVKIDPKCIFLNTRSPLLFNIKKVE